MQVSIHNLNKAFGRTVVCDNLNLTIPSGELVALLGPSGSGKTSLLRVLAGLEQADSGKVLFGDQDVTYADARKRNIGFVFQHYALFGHMTVADNVAFGLTVLPASRHPARAEIQERVQFLLNKVQLGHLGKRYPHQLSGGQRQRVALARALATKPSLLLLDEPLNNLDMKHAVQIMQALRRLCDERGRTVILVIHDINFAANYSDHIVALKNGTLSFSGLSEQVVTETNLSELYDLDFEIIRSERGCLCNYFNLSGDAV